MTAVLTTVLVAQLRPAPDNVRGDVGDITELVASVKAQGILQPLLVRTLATAEDGYEVVCGHRRYAAARSAELIEVPAVVRDDLTERQRIEAMVVENVQRNALTPLEEARAYQRLVDAGASQRDIARSVGCSQPHVSKRIQLLDLPPSARKLLDAGGITVEVALDLSRLPKKKVDELVASGGSQYIANHVRYALEQQAREEKRKRLMADAKKLGFPVVEGFSWNARQAVIRVGLEEHQKLACHAVCADDIAITHICTDPGRHAEEFAAIERESIVGVDEGPRQALSERVDFRADTRRRMRLLIDESPDAELQELVAAVARYAWDWQIREVFGVEDLASLTTRQVIAASALAVLFDDELYDGIAEDDIDDNAADVVKDVARRLRAYDVPVAAETPSDPEPSVEAPELVDAAVAPEDGVEAAVDVEPTDEVGTPLLLPLEASGHRVGVTAEQFYDVGKAINKRAPAAVGTAALVKATGLTAEVVEQAVTWFLANEPTLYSAPRKGQVLYTAPAAAGVAS